MTYRIELDVSGGSGDVDECSEQRRGFEIIEAAIATCKRIVDQYLNSVFVSGMSAEELFNHYLMLGDQPYVVSPSGRVKFSAWEYAEERSKALCKQKLL